MKKLIEHIKEYSTLLKEASIWHNTGDPLAPVINDDVKIAESNYIYEFYCYISIVIDLQKNYDIEFIKGQGKFEFKFPQAAAIKKGKPRFHAGKDGQPKFQICAGTKINCVIDSEENHPDISFQLPNASEDPSEKDLIIIMDAKFKEGKSLVLPKDEVYKFSTIVRLFDLDKEPIIPIIFDKFVKLYGNCLITNGVAYSNAIDTRLLEKFFIKEVEKFAPDVEFSVIG